MKTVLHRNTDSRGGVTWHATETLAREHVRQSLKQGEPPFSVIAEPVAVPSSRRDLAAFLNQVSAGGK